MAKRKARNKSIQHAVEKTAAEYASSSSAHGIGYITQPRKYPVDTCFWGLIVGIAIIFRYIRYI